MKRCMGPSVWSTAGVCMAVAAVLGLLVIGAAPASAFTGRTYFGFFGPDGTEVSVFPNRTRQMAFDRSGNSLLAIESLLSGGDCVDRFEATEAGPPMKRGGFTAAAGGSLCGIAANLADVAVDNSATASQGRIYVAGTSKVFAFNLDGTLLGGNFPLALNSNAIAVDSLGHLWIGTDSAVAEHDADGNLIGEPVKTVGAVSALALDSEDNVYPLVNGQVLRYAKADGYANAEVIDPANPLNADGTMTLDRSTDHLFVHRENASSVREISEYDVSGSGPDYPQVPGSPFSGPKNLTSVWGMAVDEDNHLLYVSTVAKAVIHIFGSHGVHPEVSTGGASGVTNAAATLSGSVDPEGVATTCRFEYGTSPSYGASVPCAADPGAGNGVVAVQATLSGLKSSTRYHFRLVARNAIGPVTGADQEFTTFGPPAISAAGFDSATSTEANVSAAINPANQPTTYRVEYTSEADYLANVPIDERQILRIGATGGAFTLGFEGQQSGPIPFDASAVELEAALQGLSSIGDVDGSVAVSGGPGDAGATSPYEIVFGGTLGGEDVAQIVADGSGLTGGSGVAVETATQGNGRFAVALSTPVPDGQIPAGTQAVVVKETIADLDPDSAYRFRFVAANVSGTRRGETLSLQTYPTPSVLPCGNEAFRTGPSARLPDCRAYEVVSGGLRGLIPQGITLGTSGTGFGTELASPNGKSVIFNISGASLPGEAGANGTNNRFESIREDSGWSRRLVSMSGEQGTIAHPGGSSPDHGYSFWDVEGCCGGDLSDPSGTWIYLRKPDGSFELVGQGEPGFASEHEAQGKWISTEGSHVVFTSRPESGAGIVPLAPQAPPAGTVAIYDRTPAGLKVVSILPSEQLLAGGENAEYKGVSADGSTVAFTVKGKTPIYLRIDNKETIQAVIAPSTFAGLSANGDFFFYLRNGDLFRFDLAKKAPKQVTQNAAVTVVNLSADGSHAYFVSAKVLDEDEEGTLGASNLYVWDGGSGETHLVAVLDPADLSGSVNLGRWLSDVVNPKPSNVIGPGNDPSRTTPDGSALLFESHARLSGYDNEGHREIYRYDAEAQAVSCVSCSPIGARPRSDAHLQATDFDAVDALVLIHNLSDDGDRAFFETADALVADDTNGVVDVYEWEAEGKENCDRPEGCLYLISSGRDVDASGKDVDARNYLFAATPSGDDVFIRSTDALVPESGEGGGATIYDARVAGGFPPPPPDEICQGREECGGPPSTPPASPGAGSAVFVGPGNPKARPPACPKSKRKVRRNGKKVCVKRRPHHKHKKGKGSR